MDSSREAQHRAVEITESRPCDCLKSRPDRLRYVSVSVLVRVLHVGPSLRSGFWVKRGLF